MVTQVLLRSSVRLVRAGSTLEWIQTGDRVGKRQLQAGQAGKALERIETGDLAAGEIELQAGQAGETVERI